MSEPAVPEEQRPQQGDTAPSSSDAPSPSDSPSSDAPPERRMPSSQPILMRALRWGILATVLLVVAFGAIGWFVAGSPGLVGGVLGAAFSGVFLALTIGSITFANRFIHSDLYVVAFFGIVMGSWVLKFIAFMVAAVLLRDQPWLQPTILFIAVIAGVVVSLVIDVMVVAKSRLPVVSDSSV